MPDTKQQLERIIEAALKRWPDAEAIFVNGKVFCSDGNRCVHAYTASFSLEISVPWHYITADSLDELLRKVEEGKG